MSHTMNIKTEIRDMEALERALKVIGGKLLGKGKHRLYASTEEGIGIKLNNWNYPIVIKENGEMAYDDYNGRWGKKEDIPLITAHYGLEKTKMEAEKMGYTYYETTNKNHPECLELRIQMEE